MTKLRKNISALFVLSFFIQACSGSSGGSSAADVASKPSAGQCQTSQDHPSFFEDVSGATSVAPSEDVPFLRQRSVKVDMQALKSTLLTSVQKRIQLDLFSDKPTEVYIEKIQKFSDNNLVVTGHMMDEASSVSMVIQDDVLVANIHPKDGHRYSIRAIGSGTHSIQEFEDLGQDDEKSCLAVPAPEERTESVAQDTAMAAVPVIDMLVAYTPSAVANVGGEAAMKALIQMGMADTNKAFANSGVGLSARLVGTMLLKQNETNDFSGDLSALQGKSDGRWDEVHAERARLGADQVTVVGVYPNNSVAGIGYIKAGPSSAFTIVKVGAFSIYSFSHELGHNVGLQHSDGYVNTSAGFRTIMAYGSVPRILRFSNPNISYNNYQTGASGQNSSSILNAYGNTTASLVASKVPAAGSEVPVTSGGAPTTCP